MLITFTVFYGNGRNNAKAFIWYIVYVLWLRSFEINVPPELLRECHVWETISDISDIMHVVQISFRI